MAITHGTHSRRRTTRVTDEYEVRKFQARDIVTRKDWDNNQAQVVAMLKIRTANQIAEWILEEGLVDFDSEYNVALQRTEIMQGIKVLKRKK